jgi:hypothetical protein
MPSLITLRIGCLKIGQASINATVRHWEILRCRCNSPTGRNYVSRSRRGSVQSHRRKDTIVPSFVGHLALPY